MVCLGNTADVHPELAWKIRARGQARAAVREVTGLIKEVRCRFPGPARGWEATWRWRCMCPCEEGQVKDSQRGGGVSKEPVKWKSPSNREAVLNNILRPRESSFRLAPVKEHLCWALTTHHTPPAPEKAAVCTSKGGRTGETKKLATHTPFHSATLWGCSSRDRRGKTKFQFSFWELHWLYLSTAALGWPERNFCLII